MYMRIPPLLPKAFYHIPTSQTDCLLSKSLVGLQRSFQLNFWEALSERTVKVRKRCGQFVQNNCYLIALIMRSLSLHGLFSLYINVTEKTMRSLVRSWDIHATLLPQKLRNTYQDIRYASQFGIWSCNWMLPLLLIVHKIFKWKKMYFSGSLGRIRGNYELFPELK